MKFFFFFLKWSHQYPDKYDFWKKNYKVLEKHVTHTKLSEQQTGNAQRAGERRKGARVPRVGTNAGAPSASARPEPRRPGAAPPSPRCGRRPGLGSRRPVTRRLYGKLKGRPERNFSSSLFRRFHSSPRILRGSSVSFFSVSMSSFLMFQNKGVGYQFFHILASICFLL